MPYNYTVMFMQGGGTGQFAATALNLATPESSADFIITGAWSKKASIEAAKFCKVHVAFDGEVSGYHKTPTSSDLKFSEKPAFVYMCANETIHGEPGHWCH